MRKDLKRVLASMLAIVLIFGMMPTQIVHADEGPGAPGVPSFSITLDDLANNGEYDDTFTNDYGHVYYSFDAGVTKTWTEINQSVSGVATSEATENGDKFCYRITPNDTNVTQMFYKAEWTGEKSLMINGQTDANSGTSPYCGTLTQGGNDGVNIQFQSNAPGPGGDPGQGHGDDVKPGTVLVKDIYGNQVEYNDQFKSDYGEVQYSVDQETWNDLSNAVVTSENDKKYYGFPGLASGQKLYLRTISQNMYTTSFSDGDQGDEFRGLKKTDGTLVNDQNLTPEQISDLRANGAVDIRCIQFSGANQEGIDTSNGYSIGFNPHNICWISDKNYADNHQMSDALVSGGKVEFVSCLMPDGTSGLIEGAQQNGDITDNGKVVGAAYAAKEGAILTVKLIPDYGYQFKEASINGNPVTPEAGNYTFKFKFPQGTFHFNCTFVPGQDKATGMATGVGSAAAVAGTPGDTSINGNLLMQASSATVSADDKTKMENATTSDMKVIDGAYMNLSLQSYAEKAASTDSWKVPISETQGNVLVTLAVTDAIAKQIADHGENCVIVRKHETSSGQFEYKQIQAQYHPENKTITFYSNQFSTFAIAIKETSAPQLSFASNSVTKNYGNSDFINKFTTNSDGKVTYVSSNASIATVASDGKVTLKGLGKVKITAKVAVTSKYSAGEKSYDLVVGEPKITAPTFLTVSPNGYTSMDASWTAVPGAQKYKVYYKKDSSKSFKYYKSVAGCQIHIAKLKSGTKYSVKVVPYAFLNKKMYTGKAAVANGVYTFKKIELGSVKKLPGNKVKVSWKTIKGASGYQIAFSKYKGKKFVVKSTLGKSSKSYKLKSTTKNTKYFRVRAYRKVAGKKVFGPWTLAKKLK